MFIDDFHRQLIVASISSENAAEVTVAELAKYVFPLWTGLGCLQFKYQFVASGV